MTLHPNLRIYNSLTRQKEVFTPLNPEQVKMYVCGVTVYDYCHLGHARAYVVWDMVRRYLQTLYPVRYIQNITDIDDKILRRAQEQQITMQELAERYIATYNEDMARLNILPADGYPRATDSIPAIITLIEQLIEKGFAYASGGDVYYAVQRFPGYGKLSGRKLTDMQAGASGRVDETEPHKRYPFDFALWKGAKPQEPFWESPWGNGRPGWHIECSAMVRSHLGNSIDIHAGGADLQFPHHENEIAQSEAAVEQPLAKYWLHNGFVNIDGEKMSKSLQNFTTIRNLLAVYEPMAVRLFILQAHYRQPIDFTEAAMNAATKGWETIKEALLFGRDFGGDLSQIAATELLSETSNQFHQAMLDDFNTSVAMSYIFELAKELKAERNNLSHTGKTQRDAAQLGQIWHTLQYMTNILGFVVNGEAEGNQGESAATGDLSAIVEGLIEQRRLARKSKNFKESDRLRDELKEMGITLVDQPDGTTRWLKS